MPVTLTRRQQASEADALAELRSAGFAAEAKEYAAGTSARHAHDYDVCVHVVDGEFRVKLEEDGIVHNCRPGDRLYVPAGTRHFEDHGAVRLVVGRRAPQQAADVPSAADGGNA